MSSLGLSAPSLNSYQPAITLGARWRLESVLLTVDLEGKIVEVALDEIGHFSLQSWLAEARKLRLKSAYQVKNASRVILIFGALGKEQKSLARLGRMGSISVSNIRLFATKIVGQVLVL